MKNTAKGFAAVTALALGISAFAPSTADARTKTIVKYGAIGLGVAALANYANSGYGYNYGYYDYGPSYYTGSYSYPSYNYGYSYDNYYPSYNYGYSYPSYSYGYSYPSYGYNYGYYY